MFRFFLGLFGGAAVAAPNPVEALPVSRVLVDGDRVFISTGVVLIDAGVADHHRCDGGLSDEVFS